MPVSETDTHPAQIQFHTHRPGNPLLFRIPPRLEGQPGICSTHRRREPDTTRPERVPGDRLSGMNCRSDVSPAIDRYSFVMIFTSTRSSYVCPAALLINAGSMPIATAFSCLMPVARVTAYEVENGYHAVTCPVVRGYLSVTPRDRQSSRWQKSVKFYRRHSSRPVIDAETDLNQPKTIARRISVAAC